MEDRTFEWSLTSLTGLVVAWIVVGTVYHLLPVVAVVIIGTMVELGLGGYFLHCWVEKYMERIREGKFD